LNSTKYKKSTLQQKRFVLRYVMLNFSYKFYVFYIILSKKLNLPDNIILFLTVVVVTLNSNL